MQTIGFQEAVEKILRTDNRYHSEAYAFVRDALEATLKRRKKNRKETSAHVSAAELLDGFRLHGLHEFGPMAMTVLAFWGLRTSEDVGNIVFGLIDAGVFGKTSDDTLENFRDGLNFEEAFVAPFRPAPERMSGSIPPVVGRNA